MEIQVVVEPLNGTGFRASCRSPLVLAAEAPTFDEAVQRLRTSIEAELRNGTEIVTVKVPVEDNPWLAVKGMFKDDPLFDEWQREIAEYRRSVDEAAETP